MSSKLSASFFRQDVLTVAPALLGKKLVRVFPNGEQKQFVISEVEAYRGEDDLACHASKGRTPRTEVMYWDGGYIYVYLIYGIHYMLNFVTANKENPQAVLIRGIDTIFGPGRVTKTLQIDKLFNQQSVISHPEIWIEDNARTIEYETSARIGIDYAGDYWKNRPWRFKLKTTE